MMFTTTVGAAARRAALRISEGRVPLLAGLGVLGAAAAAGLLDLWAAIAGWCVILVLTGVLPRRPAGGRDPKVATSAPGAATDPALARAVDALALPCVIVDFAQIVRHANPLAAPILGPLVPGQPLAYRLRAPQVLSAIARVSDGGPEESVEWHQRVPVERVMRVHVAAIAAGDGGRPDRLMVSFFDLTEMRRLDRMRADFVANASHELRTPLASLTGFIETLQGSARDDPAARERFLPIMIEQANRMGRLINELLSLSRIEMKPPVEPELVADLRSVIDHVVDAMAPLARDQSVTIETRLRHTTALVNGESDELVQVLQNILDNALRYGASGGRVLVTDHPQDDLGIDRNAYAVTVRDWGPGIASEHVPRLTERFYRADAGDGAPGDGTGLGLAIAKRILSRHGGELLITSVPGEGSRFIVVLPKAGGADAEQS